MVTLHVERGAYMQIPNFGEFVEGVMKGLHNQKRDMESIGKISDKLLSEFRKHNMEEDALETKMKNEIKAQMDDFILQTKLKYYDDTERLEKQHKGLWEKVYVELNVPEENRPLQMSVDSRNGEILQEKKEPEFKFEGFGRN